MNGIRPVGCLLMWLSTFAVGAADFEVSTRDWNDSQDGELSLREAIDVTSGNGRCLTTGEHNHVSGGNWQEIFASLPGCSVPLGGSRWIGHPTLPDNFGAYYPDLIKFNNFAGGPTMNPGATLVIDSLDSIDGRRPDGTLVVIDGNNAARHGLSTKSIVCTGCHNDDVTVRNLVVEDFNGNCINIGASDNVLLEHVIARSCNTGIALYPYSTDQPEQFRLRGNGYGRSEAVNNRGDGVYIQGDANTPPTNFLIISTLVADNGGIGIRVTNVPDVAIGLNGPSDGVEISGHSGDPGILFDGANTTGGAIVGNTLFGNGKGIQLSGGANFVTIGNAGNAALANVIALNASEGIYVTGASTHANSIEGNLIGALAAGDTNSGNGLDGVLINLGAYGNFVHDNVIVDNGAGTDANYGWGVQIQDAGSNGNEISDNRIGVHANGTAAGNRLGGIRVRYDAAANLIGTAASDAAQHVAGNAGPGIVVDGEGSDANLIRRNDIGFTPAGAALGNGADGVVVSGGADGTEIGGSGTQRNRIGSNAGDGIEISNDTSDGTKIVGNVIGLSDYEGSARANAQQGVRIVDADDGFIQLNLISGNGFDGVHLSGNASGWQVTSNEIGTDGDWLAPGRISNGFSAIALLSGANNNQIGAAAAPNLIVGTGDALFVADSGTTANVIEGNNIGTGWGLAPGIAVGNDGRGVHVLSSAHGNILRGNAIGASGFAGIEVENANSTVIVGNIVGRTRNGYYFGNVRGMRISNASNTQIGGASATDRNLVISNSNYGIGLLPGATNTLVRNNYVGVDSDGNTVRANANFGIVLEDADNNSLVGNLVSGNAGIGIYLYAGATGNKLDSNLIGTNAATTSALPNSSHGVEIAGSGTFNNAVGRITGQYSGVGNLIRFNGGDGVRFNADGVANHARYNYIGDNGGLGVNIGTDGVTPNDPNDADTTPPNRGKNFPEITAVSDDYVNTALTYRLDTDSPGSGNGIDIYAQTACDASGHGEGLIPIASANAGDTGNGTATIVFPSYDYTSYGVLTAQVNEFYGILDFQNSSEFSPCFSNIVRRLFADGFETAPTLQRRQPSPELSLDLAPRLLASDTLELEISLRHRHGASVAAGNLALAVSTAVAVRTLESVGATCAFPGRIVCATEDLAPGMTASVRLVLGIDPERPTAVLAEFNRGDLVLAEARFDPAQSRSAGD